MRRVGVVLTLLILSALPHPAWADASTVQTEESEATLADKIAPLKLGESSIELVGPWKFRAGDDMAWAQPDYNDSGWATMDLTPPAGSADPTLGVSGYLPGWTARGYAGHAGYAWYRLQVQLEGVNRRIALKMPESVDDAYQVYVNGLRIGEFGKFNKRHVTAYSTLPQAFRLPKGAGNGKVTIAIRMWMDSATPFNSPDAGGLHGPPVLGYASVIGALVRLDYDDIAHEVGSGFLETLILIMALLMAVALFWLDRQETAYLWLTLVCAVTLLGNAVVLSVNFTTWLGQTTSVLLNDVILAPLRIGLWVLFWCYWFRLGKLIKLHQLVWALISILMVGTAMLRPPLYGQYVPVHYAHFITPSLLVVKLGLGVLLFVVAYRGFRKQRAEGWMAAAAVLLAFVANYQHELRLIHVKLAFSIFGFGISMGTLSTVLSLLIITVMLLNRFVQAQRVKEQWKMEIQQARQVQQVLIPDRLPFVKGLTIKSEYRPAREVGGDFFQILPGEIPGTVLMIVGDVTGKGLQAGMLVALIVGAVRAAVRHSSDPIQILNEVNEQLCERQHASATCLVMRIDPDGTVLIANAGQLFPYLNGVEIKMEGALPIGIVSAAEFSIASFHLGWGDSLILMSDGVAEAQDSHGTLFGFQRVDEMLRRQATPSEIARAAQAFGQEDDILVLEIRRDREEGVQLHVEPQLASEQVPVS